VPPHRLVAIGDSLTHGFQSGAIFNTDLSYPAIIAYELGWYDQFRRPTYAGLGGLPLNIELLLRDLEQRYGTRVDWWETPLAVFRTRQFMDEVENYWERGPGAHPPEFTAINHNLGVYGWDLRDTLTKTFDTCLARTTQVKDNWLYQLVQNHGDRAALRVLPAHPAEARKWSVFDAAAALGADDAGVGHGIETLLIFIGANNALGAVTELKVIWSEDDGYDDPQAKSNFTVWRPGHFAAELEHVVAKVRSIRARHVIWCTVPHVTIAPVARGVGTKIMPGSRYFPFYTRPWISDSKFDVTRDPNITHDEARAVDSAIDQYNDVIATAVETARREGLDWLLFDVAGLLDRLAQRRYVDDPLARPSWWTPYQLPAQLQALQPIPDSRFLTAGPAGRATGGLFSLDGIHPTTIGYGILAQELINVMRQAGVVFRTPNQTPRPDPVTVDFARLIRRDTLIEHPPGNVTSGLGILGWADETADLFTRTLTFRL